MALIEVQPAKVYWAITAATSNISSRSGLSLTIGGIAVDTDGMRVLLTNQTNPMENGIGSLGVALGTSASPRPKGILRCMSGRAQIAALLSPPIGTRGRLRAGG